MGQGHSSATSAALRRICLVANTDTVPTNLRKGASHVGGVPVQDYPGVRGFPTMPRCRDPSNEIYNSVVEMLFQDADLVIFDTQYTFEESINKLDWGHSSASIAIDIAGRFNVKHLLLFHHDPG